MEGKYKEWQRHSTRYEKEICFPVARIVGKEPGPRIAITAGIHGAEYPGVAAAVRLSKELSPADIRGEIDIVTVSNVEAFENRCMFVCPVDNLNPNRLFPGDPEGSYTEILAHHIFNDIIKGSDFYMDLHSGDLVESIVPFTIYHKSGIEGVDSISLGMAEHYGIKRIISTSSQGKWPDKGTTYAAASEAGIPCIIAEAGGIGQMEEEYIVIHYNGMLNVLKKLGCLSGEPAQPSSCIYYNDFSWIYCRNKGIFYSCVKAGDTVHAGQPLGVLEDYWGDELEKVLSPSEGEVIFITTSPAVKNGGLLMGIGI